MGRKRILSVQVAIILACAVALAQWGAHFPMPSPLIQPLLPPQLRWPGQQVADWVESGNIDKGFIAFFMRDPERAVPPGRNLVSPADGLFGGAPVRDGIAYFIVKLSFWDVHVVRAPLAGMVTDIEQVGLSMARNPDSRYLDESIFLKDKAAPVQQIVTLATDYGPVRVRLITSYWASRLKLGVRVGQSVEKGERIGRILLGSTVVAELPASFKFVALEGKRLAGGETVIVEEEGIP